MPTPTYIPMATVTLGSSAGSVTFSSIPATFRDLVLVSAGQSSVSAGIFLRFNSDSGNNYNRVIMFGDGGSAVSSSSANVSALQTGLFDNSVVGNWSVQVMDYSATDKHKTTLTRYNRSNALTAAQAGRWANTAAITSVFLFPEAGTFNSGCTFSLYGIAS